MLRLAPYRNEFPPCSELPRIVALGNLISGVNNSRKLGFRHAGFSETHRSPGPTGVCDRGFRVEDDVITGPGLSWLRPLIERKEREWLYLIWFG
jgi:hypothetical protein